MIAEEEWEHLRAEKNVWRARAHEQHRDVQAGLARKYGVRDVLTEAIQAIERVQEHASTLEGQQARESQSRFDPCVGGHPGAVSAGDSWGNDASHAPRAGNRRWRLAAHARGAWSG